MVHHALRGKIQFVDRDMQREQTATEGLGQGAHLVVAPGPWLAQIVPGFTEGVER